VGVSGIRGGSDKGAAVVGLGEAGAALYPSSLECPAFMSKKKIPVRLFLLAALFRFAWRSRGGGTGRG
jgi:hypothetical protein